MIIPLLPSPVLIAVSSAVGPTITDSSVPAGGIVGNKIPALLPSESCLLLVVMIAYVVHMSSVDVDVWIMHSSLSVVPSVDAPR
jgi:hypothetical protein